jgi:Transposase DDE domain group 1
MNIWNKLAARKRRIERRLDKTDVRCDGPMMSASNIHYEVADRIQATSAGGIGMIHQLVKRLGLDREINERLNLLKIYMPYCESDHVLNIAYNALAGGTCLEHLELRRHDEAYMNALGARRIPDPTTAGDFCRRFDAALIHILQQIFNEVRVWVWQQQPASFFEEAILDADGTMVETTGQCKQGMNMSYKGEWGYHPLMVSLANTGEPLYLVNRSGNRPSHENSGEYFDLAIAVCRRAGFQQITLRGDTDFYKTANLDRWDTEGVRFLFGVDAVAPFYERVENLPKTAWKRLHRPARYQVQTQRRQRPENVKERIVVEREFENKQLVNEYVAEFRYRPHACHKEYRMVVLKKEVEVTRGQTKLFDDSICFFYITNNWELPVEQVVFKANRRCNQENLIEQHKNDVRSLTAPLDNLESNWAYMVMTALAWSLKAWAALLVPVNPRWREQHEDEKQRLLRMDFSTFRNALINIPAQIVRTSRRIICRLLNWNPWVHVLIRFTQSLAQPLRC